MRLVAPLVSARAVSAVAASRSSSDGGDDASETIRELPRVVADGGHDEREHEKEEPRVYVLLLGVDRRGTPPRAPAPPPPQNGRRGGQGPRAPPVAGRGWGRLMRPPPVLATPRPR